MTISRHIFAIAAVVVALSPLASRGEVNVVEAINNDSTTTIRVIQPAELDALTRRGVAQEAPVVAAEGAVRENVETDAVGQPVRVAGYRVQVFSDNNQRTAKGEARSKERQLREAFPEFDTYIVYNSPFWRLKVGDFRTQHEAEAAADDIKSRFPAFAREVRVVKDRVNVRR